MKRLDRRALQKKITPALAFVFLMGIVSLFSDMTHEGARSIYGAYLSLLGASAALIGFVTGLGEMIGHSLRLLTGIAADKSKRYWTMTFVGYAINMTAIPALALAPGRGWVFAAALIVFERVGKAIRQPSKNTLVSFAAAQLGEGKSFAIQEFLDQIGAFLGPVILFVVLLLKRGADQILAYALCFAVLGLPAAATLLSLAVAKKKYPNPEQFEPSGLGRVGGSGFGASFLLYVAGISLLALGFADFPLITMHIMRGGLVPDDTLPLLYSAAMLADAFAALLFGCLYDRRGVLTLVPASLFSALFSIFIFQLHSLPAVIAGVLLWGVGMGAQESILKSVVASIVSKESRSTGFGIFETAYGACWFLGSWIMGLLYDVSPQHLVLFSVTAQMLAAPLFYLTWRQFRKDKQKEKGGQNAAA